MAGSKFLKCDCVHCGGHIEFPADGIGTTIPCPHCGLDTELTLSTPDVASPKAGRNLKWPITGLIILLAGMLGVFVALKMARRILLKPHARTLTPQKSPLPRGPTAPESKWAVHTNQFTSSPVKVETQAGSTLSYAIGSLKNLSDAQRFGVTVELELQDANGHKIGTARDYRDVLEARGEWNFRALVVNRSAVSARISSIRDQP